MYGYGMLKLSHDELMGMDLGEFVQRVVGNLLWNARYKEEQTTELLEWLAWYTANIMKSSGNYKKSVSAEDIKKGLFNVGDTDEKEVQPKEQQYEQGKAELMAAFELSKNE